MTQSFPVPQEAVEAGLLGSLNQNMQYWIALQQSFTTDDFATHRDIFIFIQQYLGQYSVLPTASLLATRFHWQPPIGEFQYWMTEMKRYSQARKVLEVLNEGFQQIQNPDQALDSVLQKLSRIRSRQSNHAQATDAAALDRLEMFDNRTEYIHYGSNMLGLKTGFDVINDTKIGYCDGDLIGNYARIGVGKSWWLINEGAIAWMEGYNVLMISSEMLASRFNLRVDVVLADKMGHTIDYTKLQNGDPEIRPAYEQITRVMAESNRWWTYDSFEGKRIGLRELETLIQIHKPDLVGVDVLHQMNAGGRGQMYERIHELSYGCKDIANRCEVPILVTHHASNTERGRRVNENSQGRSDTFVMPSLNDAAYGDAFVQACSEVITMCPEPTSPNVNWYSLKKTRDRGWRQPLAPRMGIAVDFGYGKMVDLGRLGYDPEAVGTEARRVLGLANVGR